MPPSEPDIVVIDSSHDICAGASGKATGGLGYFGFRPETSSLGTLSYKLHKELANEELEIVKAGRCYRPLAIPNIPTIAKVSWEMLGNSKLESEAHCSSFKFNNSPVIGGLYLNTGHNSDGVTLGPGSGKVMSELLLGHTLSVSISNFGLNNDEKSLPWKLRL